MVDLDVLNYGKKLAQNTVDTNDYKQNFLETEGITDINIVGIDTALLKGSAFVYTKTLNGSTLVWDHPVQGLWDNNSWAASSTSHISSSTLITSQTF